MVFIVQREPYLVKSRLARQDLKVLRAKQNNRQIAKAAPLDLTAERVQPRPLKYSVPSTLGVLQQQSWNSEEDAWSESVQQERVQRLQLIAAIAPLEATAHTLQVTILAERVLTRTQLARETARQLPRDPAPQMEL
jgi:hypothetical protein